MKLEDPDKHNFSQQLWLSESIPSRVTGEGNEGGELGQWPNIEADVSQLHAPAQLGAEDTAIPTASLSLYSADHKGESQAPSDHGFWSVCTHRLG